MRKFLILILALASATALPAQSLDAFKQRLAVPVAPQTGMGSARVVVAEYDDAAEAVAQASRIAQRSKVRGYRVGIFFDNGQDARAGALAAQSLFEQTYPGIRTYPVYDSPYFRVTVGNCLTSEEAIVLKGRISATFPKAILKNEELSVTDFLN